MTAPRLRPLEPSESPAVADLFEASEAFFGLFGDRPPTRESAVRESHALFTDRPPNHPLSQKWVLGVEVAGALAGVFDVQLGYPDAATAFIGLFLVHPDARGGGIGARALALLETRLAACGMQRIELGVQMNNPAGRRFWERRGFRYVESRPLLGAADPTPTVDLLARSLTALGDA